MIILGITGGIGHGKTTLADALAQAALRSIHLESSQVIAEAVVAWHARSTYIPNPHDLAAVNNWLQLLPEVLSNVVHQYVDGTKLTFTMEDISAQPELYDKLFTHLQTLQQNPSLLNSPITTENKAQYRAILQWLGGYLVYKVDPGIWYKEIMQRASEAELQGLELCTIGGLRYPHDAEIVRSGGGIIVLIRRPLVTEQDISDPTERERAKIQPDTVVINNAGLTELVLCARHMLTDIKLGKLQAHYVASELQPLKAS